MCTEIFISDNRENIINTIYSDRLKNLQYTYLMGLIERQRLIGIGQKLKVPNNLQYRSNVLLRQTQTRLKCAGTLFLVNMQFLANYSFIELRY